jgi:hypothetical protein
MSHVEPEHNRPDEWQGGGTDHRRNPEKVKQLQAELAAERERREHAERDACGFQDVNTELLRQLAAERHPCKNGEIALQLKQQLAAEREAGVKVYLQLTLLEKKLVVERERYEKLRMETTGQVTGQSKKGNDPAANRDSDSFPDSRTVIKSYSAEALAAERDEHRKTEEVQHAVISPQRLSPLNGCRGLQRMKTLLKSKK